MSSGGRFWATFAPEVRFMDEVLLGKAAIIERCLKRIAAQTGA